MSEDETQKQGGDKEVDASRAEHEGREEMEKLEAADEVPSDPREWPDGKAKYLTYGGSEGTSDDAYGEGLTEKLGPASVEHHEDGSVTIAGEEVDDPDKYKGDPIPGGPTDPNSPDLAGEDTDAGSGSSQGSGSTEGSGEDEGSGSDERGGSRQASSGATEGSSDEGAAAREEQAPAT